MQLYAIGGCSSYSSYLDKDEDKRRSEIDFHGEGEAEGRGIAKSELA